MQDSRNDSDIDRATFTNSADSTASLYPNDRGSADSIRAILKNTDDRSDNVIKNLFDKDSTFSLTDGKYVRSQGSLKNLADGIVQVASGDKHSAAERQGENQATTSKDGKKPSNPEDKATSKPDGKPADSSGARPQDSPPKPGEKSKDKLANDPDKSNGNPDDKPADKPADKPGQKNSDGKAVERLTLDQGTIKDMATPEGFKVLDVKPSDDNPPDDNVKTTVLQHQDADKKDAKVAVTKFGYYNQQPETVKAFNEFLDSIKKEDLGKEIELTEKQMDQLYPAIPNGIDARPQSDHKFRVEEIGGKRVLITESKVSGPDGKPEDERMKTTVYANPDAAKSTIDVVSFEASNQDKDKSKPGVSNYSLLKPDVMKAIGSITWK